MKRILAAAAMAAALFASPASADDYPNRPIRVFTTSSAGGISDIFMRVLGEKMRKSLGQPLVIENHPGGAGKMAALVLTNNIRSPQLPNVPIFTDIGYKGAASQTWYGLFAPPGTPKPIVDKIAVEVTRVVSNAEFREKFILSRSLVPAINTPEEFAKEIKADREAAKQVVKESGLEPQ